MGFSFAGDIFSSRGVVDRVVFSLMIAIPLCVTLNASAVEPKFKPDSFGPHKYKFGHDDYFDDEDGAIKNKLDRFWANVGTAFYCKFYYVENALSVYGPEENKFWGSTIAYKPLEQISYHYNPEGACNRTNFNAGTMVMMIRVRAACSSAEGYRYDAKAGECVAIKAEPKDDSDGRNIGGSCSPLRSRPVGQPIEPATGNMWHIITDYQAPPSASSLSLSRIYNSTLTYPDPFVVRGFGVRWTHSYNKSLRPEKQYANSETCWVFPQDNSLECSSGSRSQEPIPGRVSITHPDGKQTMFTRSTDGTYASSADVCDRLSPVMTADNLAVKEWTLSSAKQDRLERFDATGLLLSVTERSGLKQEFTYSDGVSNDTSVSRLPATAPKCESVHPNGVLQAGRLLCVTNNWGRQIQFRYDVKGRITAMIDPAGEPTLYEYDGVSGGCVPGNEATYACKANNLTKVTYPDGKSQTYWYNEASKINSGAACSTLSKTIGNGFGPTAFSNLLTGLVDENEERHISWTYDCSGRATSSQLGEDVEKVTVAYTEGSTPSATVTHYVGPKENPITSVSKFGKQRVDGVAKITTVDAPCVECGTIAERKYDAIGNITMTKDFNNNYSCFAYEAARNLETTRVEGASTADCTALLGAQTLASPVRKTTTKWHANFRLPETVAEPKRITKYQYEALSGNLLSRTEQATTDLTGAQGLNAPLAGNARKWTYRYNKFGQLLTLTGPRTDIADVTKYDYDPLTGYLVKITNAAKQETTYGDHDAHGRVHTIRVYNGDTKLDYTETKLDYTERGWVRSQAVTSGGSTLTTFYAYKPSGQVEMVTFPDKSVTKYTYDAAHRLTSVVNDRNESIIYTLDLTGNRIKEEVRDPNGNLARQITRTYDITGRLTSQTGAAQ
ncbi:DUF6531 domain-containing protein [Massilia pseudoviolaceinigra]|uniref:DUF6531 domain-containing protein n=1 Tax=Massilia pseudoviolaceinigra TaxID=3057165 RepID=UPI002796BC5D|nr:DUF6531 domain-containing protein [Massilia sp. CCM 9206]MDQ1921304.1 DUF6531 domain-containing protein [Massilia sp. CCM 9206]